MIGELGGDFLQWLRGFYYVAQAGSITAATAQMLRNPPAISHQIKCLEDELGIVLFDRSQGGMELTPEGRLIMHKTIELFEIVKEMKSLANESKKFLRGGISIATTHGILVNFLPEFVVAFRKHHPKVNFRLEGGMMEWILKQVENTEADFGIVAQEHVLPEHLKFEPLLLTRLMLVSSKGGPFAEDEEPSLEQISRQPFITFPPTSTLAPLLVRLFAENGLSIKIIQELSNIQQVKRYVELNLGVTILDEFNLRQRDEATLNIYPLDQHFGHRRYGIITRKRQYISPALEAFMQTIKGERDSIAVI